MENHSRPHELAGINRAFVAGILLNTLFVAIELGCGFHYHSLALMSDAGHNLSDVASLIPALLAFRLAKVKLSRKFTYGYRKTAVLVSEQVWVFQNILFHIIRRNASC